MRRWLLSILLLLVQVIKPKESSGLKVVSCWKYWLKMTDNNYLRALERYDSCAKVMDELTGEMQDRYKRSLVNNLQKSSNYFFDHTEMSPAEVIRVLRRANRLMESWSNPQDESINSARRNSYKYWNEEDYDDGDDEGSCCTGSALRWYKRSRDLFYAFAFLLVLQATMLVILFCKVCFTDLLTCIPSGQFDTEEKQWLADLLNECQTRTEAYPLLIGQPTGFSSRFVLGKSISAPLVGYGTTFGPEEVSEEDEILTEISQLSSPRLGSDSEFEALMSRKALKAVQRTE